ncbi:unnamed protein product, partial [Adineta steineri]
KRKMQLMSYSPQQVELMPYSPQQVEMMPYSRQSDSPIILNIEDKRTGQYTRSSICGFRCCLLSTLLFGFLGALVAAAIILPVLSVVLT